MQEHHQSRGNNQSLFFVSGYISSGASKNTVDSMFWLYNNLPAVALVLDVDNFIIKNTP
jgi:hypothetical protein